MRTDFNSAILIWTGLASERFSDPGLGRIIAHLVGYPIEVLICMLPWSPLLIGMLDRRLYSGTQDERSLLIFVLVALAITFPTVWFATGARGRYYMPMYPLIAVLIGFVVDRCFLAVSSSNQRVHWNRFVKGMVPTMMLVGVGVLAISLFEIPSTEHIQQPIALALAFVVIAGAASGLAWTSQQNVRLAVPTLLTIACFAGVLFNGIVINAKITKMRDTAGELAEAQSQIPSGEKAVGLGIVDHKLRFLLGEPLEYVDAEQSTGDFEYFWVDWNSINGRELNFDWEEVGRVSMERNHSGNPNNAVILGRRLKSASDSGVLRIGERPDDGTSRN